MVLYINVDILFQIRRTFYYFEINIMITLCDIHKTMAAIRLKTLKFQFYN